MSGLWKDKQSMVFIKWSLGVGEEGGFTLCVNVVIRDVFSGKTFKVQSSDTTGFVGLIKG